MRDLLSGLTKYASHWRHTSDMVNDVSASFGISSP